MPYSTYLRDLILTWAFRLGAAAPARPAAIYVGLSTTLPVADGTNVTPPVFTGYARQLFAEGAIANGTGGRRTVANSNEINFGDPDANGSVGYATFYDAAAAGNFLGYEALPAVVNYQAGVTDQLYFPIGSLKFSQ